MAVYYREPLDYTYGTLSSAAAIGDTSISSAAFAALGTGYTAGTNPVVLPIVLGNPATGAHEVVWVTGHTAASTSVTVVRGKESTSAQAWPSGTQWVCAPTATRDGLAFMSAAALAGLTDAHVGMRALEIDTGLVKTLGYLGDWVTDAGVCLPAECGVNPSGTVVPTPSTVQIRIGNVNSVAPTSGTYAVTFPKAFPHAYLGALANSTNGGQFIGAICCESGTVTGMTLRPVQYNSAAPGLFSATYIAFGW